MRLEGIYLRGQKVAQEVLFNGLKEVRGLLDNESLFSGPIETNADYNIFSCHVKGLLALHQEGSLPAPRRFFLNIKPSTFVRRWQEVLEYVESCPFPIILELREDLITQEEERMLKELREKHFFFLSLDDFGRGASNFDRIILLKPDFVKLDLQVFKKMPQKSLFHIVHGLSQSLPQVKLIAEKVETEEDIKLVKSLGIEMMQGLYFGGAEHVPLSYECAK